MELLSVARMRKIEADAIESGIVSGLELMERAAVGLVAHVPAAVARIHVLAGPGNNGGDGYAAARLLLQRGAEVALWEMRDSPATPDAAEMRRRWICAGGAVRPLAQAGAAILGAPPVGTVVIDALFGVGLTRPLTGEARALAESLSGRTLGARPFVLAADIPSGLCADSGRALDGVAMPADATVTFHGDKLGHHLAEGPARCTGVELVDIGLVAPRLHPFDSVERVGADPCVVRRFDKLDHQHKYDHGHALILSGGVGKGGAARLAARAALRTGAGLVTLGCPPAALLENAMRLDAVMTARIGGADGLREALEDPRINALALGMGLGMKGEAKLRTRELVAAALGAGRKTVLDADALSAFREDPGHLLDMLHRDCVLTPHGGEFARLFPDLADRLREVPHAGPAFSRVDAVRAAARRAGCTVLLKGPDTVIASDAGDGASRAALHAATYEDAVPWLATAGAGDVLAGVVAGLLARGRPAHEAACLGAWLHAAAARAFGPGLIAEDIPDSIPAVLRRRPGAAPGAERA